MLQGNYCRCVCVRFIFYLDDVSLVAPFVSLMIVVFSWIENVQFGSLIVSQIV